MTVSDWLNLAAGHIPRSEARQILEVTLGYSPEKLISALPEEIASSNLEAANARLERRNRGEPLAYVIGGVEFFGRRFTTTKSALIPRPETELLAEAILPMIHSQWKCIDVGTGSGCLAITLALETSSKWIGTDISSAALALAQSNANRLQAEVVFLQSDILGAIHACSVDLVVSNPPYIAIGDTRVQSEVNDWEPHIALYAGPSGLEAVSKLINQSAEVLRPNGWLAFEFGMGQADAVRALLEHWALTIHRDYAGIERFALAQSTR